MDAPSRTCPVTLDIPPAMMMRPTSEGKGPEPGSPRSDTSDSQWCLLNPQQQQQDLRSQSPVQSGEMLSGPAEDEGEHPELHPAFSESEDDSASEGPDPVARLISTPPSPAAEDDSSDEAALRRWNQAQLYEADLRKASAASPPKMRNRSSTRCLKILVAGAPGTGKTTFIQNLASAYGHDDCSAAALGARGPSSPDQARGAHQPAEDLVEIFSTDPTALDEFKHDPETLCTRVLWSDDTAKINYTLLIQDTPGCQEEGAVPDAVLAFIDQENAAYMHLEQDERRRMPLTAYEDSRVDVCLYFVAPHNLRPLDIAMMQRIGALAPVVPIIAKGDSLTRAETEHFRAGIAAALKAGSPDSPVHAFPAADRAEAEFTAAAPVFSVISSATVNASFAPLYWPVRAYAWGTAEALASAHSDVPALRRLLIELSFDDLKARTEERYHAYRSARLQQCLPDGTESMDEDEDSSEEEEETEDEQGAEEDAPPEDVRERARDDKSDVQGAFRTAAPQRDVYEPVTPEPAAAPTPAAPARTAHARPPAAPTREPSPEEVKIRDTIFYASLIFGVLMGGSLVHLSNYLAPSATTAHLAVPTAPGATPQMDTCGPLNLSAFQTLHPSSRHYRELWDLIALAEGLGTAKDTAPLCPQERGALLFQAAIARAELEAQEAAQSPSRRLGAQVRSALRAKSGQLKSAMRASAQDLGRALNNSMHRMMHKMPLKTDGSRLTVDLKALKQIVMRSGVMAFWL